jgi:UDP-N-acetylmuramate dehydrogenase
MNALENVSLANHSTMGLGGTASYVAEVTSKEDVRKAVEWAKSYDLPMLMIGSGSNIVWKDEGFQGLLIVNSIKGFTLDEVDPSTVYLKVGAGEMWDSVVERTVESGLTGVEALSLIPGRAGATPVQNVGAYGQEISDTLTTVEAYDSQTDKFVVIPAYDCAFGYRTSRFKSTDKGRFFITSITLQLSKGNPSPPFYAALANYLEQKKITEYTPAVIRKAVIDIRNSKLPDPARFKNTGSFFSNPIVPETDIIDLMDKYPGMPHWPAGEGQSKLSAAWLIENAGFKAMHDGMTGMSCWPMQPLVLVNEHAKSTADLLAFRDRIITEVKNKFGVTLTQEPELLP